MRGPLTSLSDEAEEVTTSWTLLNVWFHFSKNYFHFNHLLLVVGTMEICFLVLQSHEKILLSHSMYTQKKIMSLFVLNPRKQQLRSSVLIVWVPGNSFQIPGNFFYVTCLLEGGTWYAETSGQQSEISRIQGSNHACTRLGDNCRLLFDQNFLLCNLKCTYLSEIGHPWCQRDPQFETPWNLRLKHIPIAVRR